MVLSKLKLNLRNPGVRQCLKNCQDMHRTLMKAFSQTDAPAREAHGILYRKASSGAQTVVYVLSQETPDWSVLCEQGFNCMGTTDVSALPMRFKLGSRFGFDLLSCPTKKHGVTDGNSRRVFLCSEAERLVWLKRKAEQNGFAVQWVREEGQVKEYGTHGSQQGGTMFHTGVRFRGELTVTDPERFASVFSQGIGAGKAYGFGMLMLFKPV